MEDHDRGRRGEATLAERRKAAEEAERAAILETPIVKAAFEAFPDAELENWNNGSKRVKNLEDIMAMAQNVQAELAKAQAELDTIEVEGASGGGLVKVTASAKGRIIGIAIDDSLIQVSRKADARGSARRRVQRRAGEGGCGVERRRWRR